MNVEASIRPKTIAIEIPDLGIKAPTLNALNVPNLLPPSLEIPTPASITVPNKTPNIVINPTVEYNFQGRNITNTGTWSAANHKNQDGLNLTYWSGWNPATATLDNRSVPYRSGNVTVAPIGRVPNLFYLNAVDRGNPSIRWTFQNAKAHVAGNPSWSPKGTSAMHTVWNGDITNVDVTLHGYSTFIAAKT